MEMGLVRSSRTKKKGQISHNILLESLFGVRRLGPLSTRARTTPGSRLEVEGDGGRNLTEGTKVTGTGDPSPPRRKDVSTQETQLVG